MPYLKLIMPSANTLTSQSRARVRQARARQFNWRRAARVYCSLKRRSFREQSSAASLSLRNVSPHFKRLGVMDQMSAAGGAAVSETVFYSRHGKSVASAKRVVYVRCASPRLESQ